MTNRISRRTVVAGALLVPFAGVGMTLAKNQDSKKSTPSSSPEASPSASPGASPMATPSAGGTKITVIAEDIKFDKKEIKVPANTDVEITLENHGMLQHDFRIDKLDFQIGDPLDAGAKATKTLNAPKGEYQYYCTVPGHKEAGMVGKLIAS